MRPLDDGFLELAREQADRALLPDPAHEDHQAHAAYDRRQARAALAAWDRAVAAYRAHVLDPSAPGRGLIADTCFREADYWIILTGLSGPSLVAAGR